jgi:hypothetical protein
LCRRDTQNGCSQQPIPQSPGFFERVWQDCRRIRDDSTAPVFAIEHTKVLGFIGPSEGVRCRIGHDVPTRGVLTREATRYLGLDAGARLLNEACIMLAGTTGEVRQEHLELGCGGNIGQVDNFISRLALQYIEKLSRLFVVIRHYLQPGGLLTFRSSAPR